MRLARSLLIWLTLLALPVYGFAGGAASLRVCDLAASMGHAGPGAMPNPHADIATHRPSPWMRRRTVRLAAPASAPTPDIDNSTP